MSTNKKLREVLQHAIEDLSSATGFLTGRSRDRQSKTVAALAKLQAGEMLNGLTKAETDASASVSGLTAAPVGERERFEQFAQNCPMGKYNVTRRGEGYDSSHTQIMWDAWQARASLSAGDAVAAGEILVRGEGDPLTRYRVWPDGTVQEGAESPYTWMSDDFEYVEAVNEEQAALSAAMRKESE